MINLSFSEKIHKHLRKTNVLEVGEVKIHQAHLYDANHEIVINALSNRKVLNLTVYNRNEKTIALNKVGTLRHLLSVATGYAMHH